MNHFILPALAALALAGTGCGDRSAGNANQTTTANKSLQVNAATIMAADQAPGEWLSHGRTYSEQRFSPLTAINKTNIDKLGLAWHFDFGVSRGIEATPIVHDGVMYVTASWNVVYALDARTGAQIWKYDPNVDKSRASLMCCDIVNRGVALWGDKVFTGTIDGRLIAVDSKTGEAQWDVNTIDLSKPYSITGAPRVVKGKVIIGNGGAELGVRGYVSAYDADSGDLVWRFHTVPGNPADGFENDTMAMAAQTWNGEWWKLGGGGTAWDSMAYDPKLDLLYVGTGNGSPWNQAVRSPGGGDNLFLSSIVALRPDSGEYVWHYQTTPGETWDFTATQHMILAELMIDGRSRDVIMQAPKNGFFYVIDRKTGELLSAKNFVPVNWASHIDIETGRPVEIDGARWPGKKPYLQQPGPIGGHNWHPMSYSPATGLVYLPTQQVPFVYSDDPNYVPREGVWNVATNLGLATLPTDDATFKAVRAMLKGTLVAWDPVKQEAAWSVEHNGPWNGGVLSTAGGLVFQGSADAHFAAYDAATGESLWTFFSQTGIVAAPISYTVDDEQYVAVAAGWGGAFALAYGGVLAAGGEPMIGRVLVFKIGSDGQLPQRTTTAISTPAPPPSTATAETIGSGFQAYMTFCVSCHGDHAQSSGLIPNLRHSPFLASQPAWDSVVRDGAKVESGMGNFGDLVNAELSAAIRAYVIAEANSARDTAFYESAGKTQ